MFRLRKVDQVSVVDFEFLDLLVLTNCLRFEYPIEVSQRGGHEVALKRRVSVER